MGRLFCSAINDTRYVLALMACWELPLDLGFVFDTPAGYWITEIVYPV